MMMLMTLKTSTSLCVVGRQLTCLLSNCGGIVY